MARIRTIKPEFWTDAALIECSLNARLLFIGSWNFADDFGNLDRSAKQIKARIFPADSIECEPLIVELIAHGLLIEYSVNGKKYLHIRGFNKHQVINRPGKPQCPVYDESQNTHGEVNEPSVIAPAGREGKGREVKEAASAASPGPIFGECLTILAEQGFSEKTARGYLGLLCRDYSEAQVIGAVKAAVGKADVKAYIQGVLRTQPSKNQPKRAAI